jgi:hypothetical protein
MALGRKPTLIDLLSAASGPITDRRGHSFNASFSCKNSPFVSWTPNHAASAVV